MDVTIVIPTKNGSDLLEKVLEAIFKQETTYEYEVICVDSGSKDTTVEIIKKYECKLYQISPSEFGHGKTRNYGASKGSGEYIVFLTQDAVPASSRWLENFIDAMKLDENIVGGFGIHYPYNDCNLFDKRDLKLHFEGFGSDNTIYFLDDKERYKTDEGYRHMLAFFSDNNSCIKRKIWEKYPYNDVDFAEDQIWARSMIEKGLKKVYCPYAPVYHSHNYALSTYFRRYYDEYKGLYQLHGFIISSSWFKLPLQILKHVLSDLNFVKKQQMDKNKKIYWIGYSIRRNICRYYGGFLGGKFSSYSLKKQNWLDKKISQQYKQRNG